MGKRVGIFLITLLFTFILVSCSQQQEAVEETPLAFLDVQLTVDPQEGKMNEPVRFQAKVTYGEKPVTDAYEVVPEIWRSKDENSKK